MSVCLFVCLFVSNKRQNGRTDRAQILCFYFCKIFLNFENPRIFFYEINETFFFVLKCTQREHVHNLNKKMDADRPKSLVSINNKIENNFRIFKLIYSILFLIRSWALPCAVPLNAALHN